MCVKFDSDLTDPKSKPKANFFLKKKAKPIAKLETRNRYFSLTSSPRSSFRLLKSYWASQIINTGKKKKWPRRILLQTLTTTLTIPKLTLILALTLIPLKQLSLFRPLPPLYASCSSRAMPLPAPSWALSSVMVGLVMRKLDTYTHSPLS